MGVIKEWEIKDGKLGYVRDWKGHETSVSCLHAVEDGLWSGTSSVHITTTKHATPAPELLE